MVQNLVTIVRQSEMDGRPGQGGLLDNLMCENSVETDFKNFFRAGWL